MAHLKPPPEAASGQRAPNRKTSVVTGAATLFASSIFSQILGLATLIVTARLLTPTDFGVIAYFVIAVALLEIIQRAVSMTLIRQPDITEAHLNTVFTMQVLLGLGAACLIWLSTPLMPMLGLPELTELIPALCIISVLISLKSPRFPLLERDLRFAFVAGEEAISRFVYTVFAILLAWIWRDFWAVVVANFLTQVARVIWTYSTAPMWPRLTLSRWRDCLNISSWSLGAQITQFLTTNTPQLIIGATLGLADAGTFRIGFRLVSLFTNQAIAPLERVIYPALAHISRTDGTTQKAFEQTNAILLGTIIPVSVGMALVANHMIIVVIGWQWLAAAQVIWVLAPLKAIETLQANVRSASYVKGDTKRLCIRNSILLVVTIVLMLIGSSFGYFGAILGTGLSSVFAIFLTLIMARDFGTGGFFGPILVAWRSIVSTLVMVAVVLLVGGALGNHDQVGWAFNSPDDLPLLRIRFLAKVLAGVIAYVGAHLFLWHLSKRPEGFESAALNLAGGACRHVFTRGPRGENS